MTMKASELIAGLERFKEAHGDLIVSVTLSVSQDNEKDFIFSDDNLILVHNEFDDQKEEIGIQNFMY